MSTLHSLSLDASPKALSIGQHAIYPPVVLAPMAGITHYPFRKICQSMGAGLTVSEMVTARCLLDNDARTRQMAHFGGDESLKSVQLYATDPHVVQKAIDLLVTDGKVDHIDLNFGCPVKKVTRKGGGAAIPLKQKLFAAIIHQAVKAAGALPVTVKFRMGIDDDHLNYLACGQIAESEGAAAVALHARTAEQFYSGRARWHAITQLKDALKFIPVLGNGDIWCAEDAMRMMKQTQCDGVVIGRGCLGRPWLFDDIARKMQGKQAKKVCLFDVIQVMCQLLDEMVAWFGEYKAVIGFRKHAIWFLSGFGCADELISQLMPLKTMSEVKLCLKQHCSNENYPKLKPKPMTEKMRPQKVVLPYNYLNELNDDLPPNIAAEVNVSGG